MDVRKVSPPAKGSTKRLESLTRSGIYLQREWLARKETAYRVAATWNRMVFGSRGDAGALWRQPNLDLFFPAPFAQQNAGEMARTACVDDIG